MAIGGIKRRKLNKQSILDKISEYDIFRYYMPNTNWNLNVKTHSPFREERTPSFIISQGHNGVSFYDFGWNFGWRQTSPERGHIYFFTEH